MSERRPKATDLVGTALARWPAGLPRAVLHFSLLCLGIVLMTMAPFRIEANDKSLVYVLLLAVLGGILALLALRRRVFARVALAETLLTAVRTHLGLPLVGLVFFLVWTAVYACLWLFHPTEAFVGLSASPRLSDFFYYAVSTAFLSPPEGIAAGSRGVRAASLIELVMGLAVVASYVTSFFDWSREQPE